RSYSKDGKRETDFLPVVVWRAQADNCARYLKKGSRAAISGSVQTRSYDAQDGSRRYVTEIAADEVQFLSTKGDDEEGDVDFDDLKPIDEDLPF
ncbi:MAG: single-stranded DNA-binding protein, partial [Clostridia bacterium]|nr:single-stranded DNA-binding protein [Clostridia bacterium]